MDIYLVTRGEEPRLFQKNASSPSFSPDGRWIAYSSPPSGLNNVFVRPVEGEGKWQVSRGVGSYAHWMTDGNAIFFMATQNPDRPILRVDVLPGEGFRIGPPVEVLKTGSLGVRTSTAPACNWDVSPDGERFVFVEPQRGLDAVGGIQVVLGWATELEGKR